MSIPCDCKQCGGKDDFAMCENALMYARAFSQKSTMDITSVRAVIGIAVAIAVVVAMLM